MLLRTGAIIQVPVKLGEGMGEMKLHLAELCIEQGRDPRQGNKDARVGDMCAKGHYEEARRLIEECRYHRRDEELKELERGIS